MSDVQTLHALSRNTVSLIGSCQVITSAYSVVKELVENSLDANASSVDVKLEDFGLEKIEVHDNGKGVKAVDVPFMAKRHFTSKISSSEDLHFLTSYGFRGEALGSLCAVSHLTITTKTDEDKLSSTYTIGSDGDIVDKKPSHNGRGTIISSRNLFYNVPVRKQYCCGSRRRRDDLKNIEHLLMMYALVKPNLRLTLKHGKELVFQKTALKDVKSTLPSVLGRQVANQMLFKEKCIEELQLKVSVFLPKPGSDVRIMSSVLAEKTFVAVNERPVSVPELNKVLKRYYSNCHSLDNRYPVCFVTLDIATNQIDVNVDPNKTKIIFQQKADIVRALEEILVEIYGPLDNVPSWHYQEPDNGKEIPEEIGMEAKEIKNSGRPFITYSKLPGDTQEEDREKSSDSSSEKLNGTDVEEESFVNNKTSLPSFSLTFHSKSSDQPTPASCTKISISEEESDKTNHEIQNDSSISTNSPLKYTATVNFVSKNEESASDDSFQTSGKEMDTVRLVDEDILLDNDVDTLTGKSDSPLNSDQEMTLSKDKETDVQEVTIVDNDEFNEMDNENGLFSSKDSKSLTTTVVENSENCPLDIDPSDWSRGNVTVGDSVLQPVKLLPPSSEDRPGKRPSSPSKTVESSQPRQKIAKLNLLSNQATLFDMMNTQKIKKPESPFTHFHQEKFSSLSQEYPEESTATIEERLKESWSNLTDDERVSYREKCWHDTKRYEKDRMSINNQSTVNGVSGKEIKTVKKATGKLKKPLKKKLYCKERVIKIPMNDIRNPRMEPSVSTKENEPKIVGPSHNSDTTWYCTLHNKLYLVNVWRLSEVALYKKLKAEHKLPVKPCDPVILNSRTINERGLQVLQILAGKSQSNGTYFHITDERLIANGFDIKCHSEASGDLVCELVGICDVIPAYDVKDLNVVLGVLHSNPDASLIKTRSLKAAYYLQGEALRMTRQNVSKKSTRDVQALLNGAIGNVNQPCFHHKPIFKELIDFSNSQLDDD